MQSPGSEAARVRRDFGWAVVSEQFTALCERVAQLDDRVEQHGRRIKAFALSPMLE